MSKHFQLATISSGLLSPSIALATHRAGELAILDFEYVCDHSAIQESIRKFSQAVSAPFGLKLNGDSPELLANLTGSFPDSLTTVILTSRNPPQLEDVV